MIIQKIRAKNFLSIGSTFIEVDIQKYSKTILDGLNGSGKSSINNIIMFGLFGQMIKNITKPQIINSTIGKNCVVEVELLSNDKQYLIRRGIKPNIFDIIEDGIPLNQMLTIEFQDYLERNILKINYKSFLQTSILSVENYKPFMALRAFERRAFVEDILDIKVFSYMNQIIKAKNSKNKEDLKIIDVQLKAAFTKAKMQKQHIDQLESINTANTDQIKNKIDEINKEINTYLVRTDALSKEIKKNINIQKDLNDKSKEHQSLLHKIDSRTRLITESENKIKSVNNDTNCPICNSEILEHTKDCIINPLKDTIIEHNNIKSKLMSELSKYDDLYIQLETINNTITADNNIIHNNNVMVNRLSKDLALLETDIELSLKSLDLSDMKAELKVTASEALKLKQTQSDINSEQLYYDMMIELFKDSGIKTKIIDQYIPIINGLINKYLEKLDFFVSFNLDAEFNEIIKSPNRSDFTYGSFSAGERAKIDIAIVFAFRELSKMRNSFDCNLLFLDEILEFLDEYSVDSFLKMIYDMPEFKNSNIFIISHKNKDKFSESFDGNLLMYKESGFSMLKDISK